MPRLYRVILPVSDLPRAVAFYSGVLDTPGATVSPGRHYFDCEGTILACFDPRADGDDYDAAPNPEQIYFAVDDIHATLQACREAGARFSDADIHGTPAGEIAMRPWGEESFYVSDPFGNQLCFVNRETIFTG